MPPTLAQLHADWLSPHSKNEMAATLLSHDCSAMNHLSSVGLALAQCSVDEIFVTAAVLAFMPHLLSLNLISLCHAQGRIFAFRGQLPSRYSHAEQPSICSFRSRASLISPPDSSFHESASERLQAPCVDLWGCLLSLRPPLLACPSVAMGAPWKEPERD